MTFVVKNFNNKKSQWAEIFLYIEYIDILKIFCGGLDIFCNEEFQCKQNFQEAEIVRLEQQHDENLAEISIQLLRLQVIKIRIVITN